jgi:hypothetical protein
MRRLGIKAPRSLTIGRSWRASIPFWTIGISTPMLLLNPETERVRAFELVLSSEEHFAAFCAMGTVFDWGEDELLGAMRAYLESHAAG